MYLFLTIAKCRDLLINHQHVISSCRHEMHEINNNTELNTRQTIKAKGVYTNFENHKTKIFIFKISFIKVGKWSACKLFSTVTIIPDYVTSPHLLFQLVRYKTDLILWYPFQEATFGILLTTETSHVKLNSGCKQYITYSVLETMFNVSNDFHFMHNATDLISWNKANDLCKVDFDTTLAMPKSVHELRRLLQLAVYNIGLYSQNKLDIYMLGRFNMVPIALKSTVSQSVFIKFATSA